MNQFMMKVEVLTKRHVAMSTSNLTGVYLYEPEMKYEIFATVLPEEAEILSKHETVVLTGKLYRGGTYYTRLYMDRPRLIFCTGGVGFLYANVSHSLSDSMAVVIVDPPGRPNQHEGRKFVLVHKALVDAKRGQRLLAVYHPTGIDRLGMGQMPRITADEVYLT